MKPAWRGIVDKDGDVWAWPTLMLDHSQAFYSQIGWAIRNDYRARWRQWEPGGKVDFDTGVSKEDIAKVEEWVKNAS